MIEPLESGIISEVTLRQKILNLSTELVIVEFALVRMKLSHVGTTFSIKLQARLKHYLRWDRIELLVKVLTILQEARLVAAILLLLVDFYVICAVVIRYTTVKWLASVHRNKWVVVNPGSTCNIVAEELRRAYVGSQKSRRIWVGLLVRPLYKTGLVNSKKIFQSRFCKG